MFYPSDQFFKNQENEVMAIEKLEMAQEIANINVPIKCDNALAQYVSELVNHISNLRASNLLLMQSTQDFGFLDGTTNDSILEDCFKKPQNIIRHISPKISQSLGLLISFIHSNPKKFANLLMDYFSNDMTLGTSFAYSTFPAIFGYFSTAQLNLMGSKIITYLINQPEMLDLSCLMTAAYLHTQHKFINAIFSEISEGWAKSDTGNDFFLVLATHINRGLSALDSVPAMIIKNLETTNPEAFVRTMAVDFLLPLVIIWGRYGPFRSNLNCLKQLVAILRHIGDDPSSIEGCALRTAFSECDTVACCDLPSMPPPEILPRISLVFSDRDITVLADIIALNPPSAEDGILDVDTLISCARRTFKKGYAPFFIAVLSPIERQKKITKHQTDRSINMIIRHAQDSGKTLLDFVLNPPCEMKLLIDDRTRNLIFKEILSQADNDYEALENLISICLLRKEICDASQFVEMSVELQIYQITDTILASKALRSGKNNMNNILTSKRSMPAAYSLAVVTAYLDRLRPTFSPQMKKAIEIYTKMVGQRPKYVNSLWSIVSPMIDSLDASFKLGYGSILRSVIHIAGLLNQITGDPIEWSELFEALICGINPKSLLQAFAVFRDYLLENYVIATEWDQQTSIKFTSAYSVFRKFIMQEPELSQIFELSVLIL